MSEEFQLHGMGAVFFTRMVKREGVRFSFLYPFCLGVKVEYWVQQVGHMPCL